MLRSVHFKSLLALASKRSGIKLKFNVVSPAAVSLGLPRDFSTSSYFHQKEKLRIGCASGFWGDTAVAAPQLVMKGSIDYLVLDYLSEITMSLMTAARNKNPDLGFAPDFVETVISPLAKSIKQQDVRVVTNAGGVNPASCGQAIRAAAAKAGVDLQVAVVTGDSLMPRLGELGDVREIYSGLPFPPKMTSMNAYLGAGPVARALALGADVVVTGRCVDSALALGPLMHEFGWDPANYDLMAAGSLAGHLIECGAQCTGGIFTDWHTVPGWENIGFPIAEVRRDGVTVITKPPGTGGLVSRGTVAEQLVYEIGDPSQYLLPDVTADFSHVTMTEVSPDKVEVEGAKGLPPTAHYKVSGTYMTQYRTTAVCCVGGPRAAEKARRTADAILKRVRGILQHVGLTDFTETQVQVLGAEDTYGAHAAPPPGPREAVVFIAATHGDKRALQILAREIAPAGTGMAPGLTGIVGGRPKVSPVLKLYSFLHPKQDIEVDIAINGESVEKYVEKAPAMPHIPTEGGGGGEQEQLPPGSYSYRIEDLAYTRSGDKGNSANIGVIAREPRYLPVLRGALTAEAVTNYFRHLWPQEIPPVVRRYELPGVSGLNFVLEECLGGGGVASLRSDPQGKALGQMLLDFTIDGVPKLDG